MQILFVSIFTIIFFAVISCVLLFRKYNEAFIKQIDTKTLSLRFVLGFSTWCTDNWRNLPFVKKSNDKNLYIHHIKLASYIIVITLICSFMGFAYTVSLSDKSDSNISEISRPSMGNGMQDISLITDSEAYSGTIDITVEERHYSFDEAMNIFSSYRAEFDSHVLGDNSSFLHVTNTLNMPSTWGDENISVSWNISNPDIIDYTGKLQAENIPDDGIVLEVVATLTLDETSADICYQLKVYPPDKASKSSLISYLHDYINSDENLTKDTITLPTEFNGQPIYFFEAKEVYPSVDIYGCNYSPTRSYHPIREKRL